MLLKLAIISLLFLVILAIAIVVARRYVTLKLAARNRGLFRFHDGRRVREADPVSVLLALEAHPEFRLDRDPTLAIRDGDSEAMAIMTDAVRSAFNVPAFTSKSAPGLTSNECVHLLATFLAYVDLQKKSIRPTPTSPQSTEPTSNPSGEPTTPAMSASG